MSGNDPTNDLDLMVKSFEIIFQKLGGTLPLR
jgi:hypothetical protein